MMYAKIFHLCGSQGPDPHRSGLTVKPPSSSARICSHRDDHLGQTFIVNGPLEQISTDTITCVRKSYKSAQLAKTVLSNKINLSSFLYGFLDMQVPMKILTDDVFYEDVHGSTCLGTK